MSKISKKNTEKLTFSEHLDIFRKMLFRIIFVSGIFSIVIFICKESTFDILLAPSKWDFITYKTIENILQWCGFNFHFTPYNIKMISTDLSAQFMTHVSTSIYLGLLIASPYILFELFKFILPALYKEERRHSLIIAVSMYLLFSIGVLMNYFIIFPISFRFLGTYNVDVSIENNITISSYIKTFSTLTFVLGIIFQLPIVSYILAKMNLIKSNFLKKYRRHAFIIILIVSAIITPPDIFTLFLVAIPLYLLFELCILIVAKVD